MEGGMFVSKQIHLDEQACSVHLCIRATFSPWGLRAHLLEPRDAPSIRVVRGGRAGTPSSSYFLFVTRRVGMRFTVRSLGGKLIISAAFTLLLCVLLFATASWYLLKSFYEHEAKSDAAMHLALIKHAYQAQTALLSEELSQVANNPGLMDALAQPLTQSSRERIRDLLFSTSLHDHFSEMTIASPKQRVIETLEDISPSGSLPDDLRPLVVEGLRGKAATLVKMPMADTAGSGSTGDINVAVPILAPGGKPLGILIGEQRLDDYFAADLLRESGNLGLNVVLCQGQQIQGTTIHSMALDRHIAQESICASNHVNLIDTGQHYLTMSAFVRADHQVAGSPSLLVVDIEPLYNFNTHSERAIEILIGIGFFIIALGVTAYTFIARTFFIRPIRRLQASIAHLVSNTTGATDANAALDELSMLARSFNLLSESLNTQENESHMITSRMSDLLTMSDILISTLNLEDLLREIVSRLGRMMHAKSVSLLLYGREMTSPWAVAQWSDTQASQPLQLSNGHLPDTPSLKREAVTVHADPAGDITMAATTKMVAMPVASARAASTSSTSSGKRRAIRALKLTPPPEPDGLRRPRIPRPALRDLDMLLARMAMQREKIAYGEDVHMIYRERGEAWARMALEAGYRSVVAVPLFLQDQAIGAVMLYGDRPYQVSGRDTFLLSTAAIQAAMAIQNALLFVEVKDKNAALERVNHLKSQFLATVTHELRTPLHSIISYGSLILEGYLDGELTEEQQEHISFIVRRAEDLSRLVDDMLDLSKIEADRLEVKVEPLSLEQSLQDAMNELKQMAGNKGLALTLEMDEELPMALTDSHRIRQVVVNLVSNALKFTENGGVTIRCMLLERYDMLRISVSDTGIGISPAALDYIFEAFRQADGSVTRRFGGTGLGLTIARKLIELQGGEVTVESIVGQGSTFSFTLPIVTPARVRMTV